MRLAAIPESEFFRLSGEVAENATFGSKSLQRS
jgi:hypothetical protein